MLLFMITDLSETNSPPFKLEETETKPGNIILSGCFQLVFFKLKNRKIQYLIGIEIFYVITLLFLAVLGFFVYLGNG